VSAEVALFLQNRDFVGTVLLHMPLLWSVRRHYGDCRVTAFATFPRAELLREAALADDVRVYRRVTPGLVRDLRRMRADLLVNLRPSSEPLHLAVGLSRARLRIGFRGWPSRVFYHRTIERDRTVYRALLYLRAAELGGIVPDLRGCVHALARPHLEGVAPGGTRFCIVPGGGTGAFKRWGIPNFAALCRELSAETSGAEFVFLVGADDREAQDALAKAALPEGTRVLVGAPLGRLCAEVLRSAVVVGNDCGPVHLAQIGGARFVGIYSNEDGHVRDRLAEWFLPRKDARAVTSAAGQRIADIPVAAVLDRVQELRQPA
jgi:ADP-heptose:LPS heptosyltransferase